jgi:hypothetical protein
MPHTAAKFSQDTAETDGQLFVGADEFKDLTGGSTLALASGLLSANVPASASSSFIVTVDQILRALGYATANGSQQQFGTAANVPGPSAVANTSSPLAIVGRPPYTGATLPTVKGPVTGIIPKGFYINYLRVFYKINGVALTSATVGITQTTFKAATSTTAPIVTNVLALANNGLVTATLANYINVTVPISNPTFFNTDATQLLLNLVFTTPASSTLNFYGVVLNITTNYL